MSRKAPGSDDVAKLRKLLGKIGVGDINAVKYEKNVEREQVVNQKIVIKKSKVQVVYPAVVANDKVIEKADELFQPGIGFVREDLVYAEGGMLALKPEQIAILRELRPCIDPKYFRALISAYTIINFEDIGDGPLSEGFLDDLIRLHKERGRHLYNLARSGYIEGYFLHHLRIMKFESGSGEGYKERFRQFFERKISFFELAVWAGPLMSSGDVARQLSDRMTVRAIPTVKVYGRGNDNIRKVEEGCNHYFELDKNAYLENDERYKICHSACCCWTVSKRLTQRVAPRSGRRKIGP